MADEANTPAHRYYQPRYNILLAPNEVSRQLILASGIRKIDNAVILPFFALAEPGVWYDPSDLTTLFQDNAGTTPVTAPGQTVGLMLDKSNAGNHATQATSTQRPTYGINPITGTRNLLTFTEQFDNAAWVKFNAVVAANTTVAPDGTLTAESFAATTANAQHYISFATNFNSLIPDNTNFVFSCYFKPNGRVAGAFSMRLKNSSFAQVEYNLTTQLVTTSTNIVSSSITPAANGFFRVVMVANSSSGAGLMIPAISDTFSNYIGDGTNGILIWGAQLEIGSTATAYQRVTTQYDVTEAGVQSAQYLQFDGVDDGMVTGTITPGIDKVQVFAGVRKLSDAAQGIFCEFSADTGSNNGSFRMTFPGGAGSSSYGFVSKGTLQSSITSSGWAAPITNVISAIGDISNDIAQITTNGVLSISSTDQGTGNYLAYPLYIGRRGGTTFPFNGRLYSLIIRFGPNLTAGQITTNETWVNSKTGAY